MRIGNLGFWPSAVAGGFFILRGKRAGAGKNPAVTALPCQGPLGKRVMGEEGTDCHSRCAHRLRNDTFLRSAVGRADVGIGPYGGVTRGVIQVRAAGWGHPGLRRELGWVFSV